MLKAISEILIIALLLSFMPVSYSQANRQLTPVTKKYGATAKRMALVIGNGDYRHTDSMPKLSNPINDADDMAAALQKFGFHVTAKKNLGKEEMDEAITDFGRKIVDSDAVLFYYAGHGLQVKGQNYLVPVDANIDSEAKVPYRAININQLLEEIESSKSRVNIVMLDACRNNPISGRFRSGGGRGLAPPSAMPKGTVIVYATDPGNVASDGNGRNGVFTSGILSAFNGNDLTLAGVLYAASKQVQEATGQQQTPYVNGPPTIQHEFSFISPSAMTDLQPSELQPKPITPQKPIQRNDYSPKTTITNDDEEKPPNTISVKIKTPKNALLNINGKVYDLNAEPIINFPYGSTAFSLYLSASSQTIYGSFDVKIVDETTKAWIFGLDNDKALFKEQHIQRALLGQPVFYGMRTNTDQGTNEVFVYKLSLQKIR